MRNAKHDRNEKIRTEINEMLSVCKPGNLVFSDAISISLSTRHRSVTNKSVSRALRERSDIKCVAPGTWMVLSCA